jgi:orotidine-5'-phosphate decarboxylase
VTPEQAVAAGASYLVLGRAVTGAPDPGATLRGIVAGLRVAPAPSQS